MATDLLRYRDLAHTLGRGRLGGELHRGTAQRVSRGVYSRDRSPANEEDRLHALFLRLPAGTMLGYQNAAARYGFGTLRTDRVHVVVPPGTAKPRIRGVVAHESVLEVSEPAVLGGIPCVPAARCAIDLARSVRRMDALPVLDAALRVGVCDPDELAREVAVHHGLRGVRQARELVLVSDGRAECRQESQLRLVIIDGRLPLPDLQVWVDDEFGDYRYRLDLAYRERRVGLEYDGVSHMDRGRLHTDRQRHNWLAARGWVMRYFTDADLYRRPGTIVTTVRAALST